LPPNTPTLPSLDQTLLDIRVPGRVQTPTAGVGLQNLAPSSADPMINLRRMAEESTRSLESLRAAPAQTEKQPFQVQYGPQIGYSPSTGKIGVNGFVFNKDDYANALESEKYLGGAPQALPRNEVADWVPLSQNAYSALLKNIREPGIGDLFMRNVDIGFAGSQQLLGSGLQLVGAEKLGSDIAGGAQQRLDQLSPFQREFTSIQDAGDVGEFLIATFGQFTPSVLEAVVTGGVGSIAGKTIAKQLLSKEAKKQFSKDVLAYQAAKKAKDTATMKALGPAVREKAGYYGALVLNGLNSYRMGASDVYGELRQQGVDPNDVNAKMAALAYGLPYGALEALPEFFAFNKILNPKYAVTTPSLARRVASGTAIGGLGGGATEAGQEAILMAAGEQVADADYSDEYAKRLVNSFAAGAAFGGPVGGAINALAPVNLLKTPPAPAAAAPPRLAENAPVGTQGELFGGTELGKAPGQMELFPGADLGTAPAPVGPTQLDLFAPSPAVPTAGLTAPFVDYTAQRELDLGPPFGPDSFPRPSGMPREAGAGFDAAAVPVAPPVAAAAPVVAPVGTQMEMFAPEGLGQTTALPPAPQPVVSPIPSSALGGQREMFSYQPSSGTIRRNRLQQRPPISFPNDPYRVSPNILSRPQRQQEPPPAPVVPPTAPAGPTGPARGAAKIKTAGKKSAAASKPAAAPKPAASEATALDDARAMVKDVTAPGKLPNRERLKNLAAKLKIKTTKRDTREDIYRRIEEAVASFEPAPPPTPPTGKKPVPKNLKQGSAKAKAAASKPAASKKETLQKGPKGAAVDENDGAVRVERDKGLRYVEYQTSVADINERLQFAIADSDNAVRLFAKNPAAAIRSISQHITAAVGEKKYAVSNTLKKLKTDFENLEARAREARARTGETTNVLKQEFEKLVEQVKTEYAAFREREADLVPKEPSPTTVAGTKQPAAAGATAGRGRAAEPAGASTAKEGPAEDKGVSKKPTVREIKTVEQAQAVFKELVATDFPKTDVTKIEEFKAAAKKLIEFVFLASTLETNSGKRKAIKEKQEEISAAFRVMDASNRQAFNEVFADVINNQDKKSVDAIYKTGAQTGQVRPWYAYAVSHDIKLTIRINMQDRANAALASTINKFNTEASAVDPATPKTAPAAVAESVDEPAPAKNAKYIEAVGALPDTDRPGLVKLAQNYVRNGVITKEQFDKLIKESEGLKDALLEVLGTARFIRNDGTALPINKGVDFLKAKATVTKIVNGFKVKPKVHVYINIQNLKLSNPELYERARRARSAPEEFESGNFDGYAFGNDIIILTSKIQTDTHLKTVLAHETLGHFGLRSIFSDADLTTLLTEVLATDRRLRSKAREKAFLYKIDEIEAAEEALSDIAAQLENNTLLKVWNAIKDALNLIGIKFGDEMARYLIRLAGRYVKKGEEAPATVFNVATIRANMSDLAIEGAIGRFSASPLPAVSPTLAYSAAFDAAVAGAVDLQKKYSQGKTLLPRSTAAAVKGSRNIWRKVQSRTAKVSEAIQSLDSKGDLSEGLAKLYKLFQDQANNTQRLIQKYMDMLKFSVTDSYATEEERLQAGKMASHYTLYRQNLLRKTVSIDELAKGVRKAVADEAGKPVTEDMQKTLDTAKIVLKALNANEEFVNLDGDGLPVADTDLDSDKKQKGIKNTTLLRRVARELGVEVRTVQGDLAKIGPLGNMDSGIFVFNTDNLNKITSFVEPDINLFRKGFDALVTEDAMAANIKPVTLKFEAMPDLTKDSKEWIMFKELLTVEQEKAKDLLQSKYERYIEYLDEMKRKLGLIKSTVPIGQREIDFFFDVKNKYLEIIHLSQAKDGTVTRIDTPTARTLRNGDQFFVEVLKALHSKPKLNDWKGIKRDAAGDQIEIAEKYITGPLKTAVGIDDKFIAELEHMNTLGISQETQIKYINPLYADHAVLSTAIYNAEERAKNTIAMGYVPLMRRGNWEVRLEAYDPSTDRAIETGKGIKSLLPYFMVADEAAANDMAYLLKEPFENQEFLFETGEPPLAGEPAPTTKIKFRVVTSEKGKLPPLGSSVDFGDFLRTLLRMNIDLNPDQKEAIIQAMTAQESAARRNMLRSGTVGWNPDIVQSVTTDVQTGAHVASGDRYSHRTDEIMSNRDNWYGSEKQLRDLRTAWESAKASGNAALAHIAHENYSRYAYRFVHMAGKRPNSPNKIKFWKADGTTIDIETLGEGERFRDDGKKLLNYYQRSDNIIDPTEGILTEQGGALKNAAVFLQLSLNVSSGLVQAITLPFNVIPYLSFYNPKRGYGGGFGLVASTLEIFSAIGNVANPLKQEALQDAAALRSMIENNEYGSYGLTLDEAFMFLGQAESGNLLPAQTNTLLHTSRSGVSRGLPAQILKVSMSFFSWMERTVRMVTALAAYRLYKQRAIAAKIDGGIFNTKNINELNTSQVYKDVYESTGQAVIKTNGDYNQYNRPELFRNHFTQYIFMYRMPQVVTMQMAAALPIKGQITFAATIIILAGIAALPGAEDLFDIADTIIQFFKLPIPSVEAEIANLLNNVTGGHGRILMNGILNEAGFNVSSKISMGDILPGSGMFRAGADPGRELMQLAGPVFSAMHGTLNTGFQLAHWGVASTGLTDKTMTLPEILRNSPSSAVKGWVDSLTYLNDGRITDAKGKVISEDVSTEVILARMLGFFPAESAQTNRVIRLSQYTADYAKAIAGGYRSAYVQAYVRKDFARMREIANDVREWNKSAKDTPFFIKDFEERARKAGKEASIPAAARYLKVAPDSSEAMVNDLISIYGLEDGTG